MRPTPIATKGDAIGDFLEAWKWDVLALDDGRVRVRAHLPMHVRNPRDELFGGFTPTYVDFMSLTCVKSEVGRTPQPGKNLISTISMQIDYVAPITGPTFTIDSTLEVRRSRTCHITTRFFQDDQLAVLAATTILDRHRGS